MISLKVQSLRKRPVAILTTCALLLVISCTEEPPLVIGFVGGLTGRVADLGVAGRDGVILAVEEKNQSGGIAGRKVKLVVKDDQQKEESAGQAIRELTDEPVLAIIGPMTSSIAIVIQPLINADQVVTISPTAKTDQLSGEDDFFLRVTTPLSKNAEKIAAYAVNDLNLINFAVVYDLSNRAFTETWLHYFKQALQEKGGHIVIEEAFSSQPDVHFLPIAERLLKTEPDGVLLLSNAIDTALLAQQIRKLESNVAIFSSEWAFTTDLLSFGGRAVNGMTSFQSFNTGNQEVFYLSFKDRFTKRFGYAPSFATVLAYDAVSYLFAGLEKNPLRDGLKETLLSLGPFPGLQSTFTLDAYGDVDRKLFMTVVEDGRFKVVQ
jgi:branched-chain amino acid transport system substrate-binding protein